jgi:AcrR family transcriptional regulator
MPKIQRTLEEVEAAKTEILEAAVNLIVEIGYNNFTMRKLASKLGITATTIYNYYKNKDDLYINLLIRGFKGLYERLAEAHRKHSTPAEKLRAMLGAYTDYGLNHANFYNLMYSWHVPKFNDYVGTSMEPVARRQLEGALKVPEIFFKTIKTYALSQNKILSDEEAMFLLIHYWSQIHGFIAGCNNTNLNYLHNDPKSLKRKHLDYVAEKFERDLSRLNNHQGGKK